MHRHPPSLSVVDRTIEPDSVVYLRLNDNINEVKLNNNNDQHSLTPYKMPGLLDAAVSLAEEEAFLPNYTTVPYTTSTNQVSSATALHCYSAIPISPQ
ncbi:hypothetical protein C0J52_18063 [Blattella germanica]|nr:hypothetical protein C0J52_18063 [Blattella germanica]